MEQKDHQTILEYFHIIEQKPFDSHHDVFEGVAVDVMSNYCEVFFFLWSFFMKCWSYLIAQTVTKLISHNLFKKRIVDRF